MRLGRAVGTIGGLTLISRVLGMVRDTLMARYVGAGLASDAFLIAWRLPNLFRALFAEGAFAAAFVPLFNHAIADGEREAPGSGLRHAVHFASAVLSVLVPVLILFTLMMIAAAGPIVYAMSGGFPDGGPAKEALAVALTRITFPYLGLISVASLLGGILNSLERYWVNAAAPILLNLCMIVALLFFRGDSEIATAYTQSIAVTVSGAMQMLWLIWACRSAGVRLKLRRPRLTPGVRRLLALIGPAALGQGAIQVNLLISTALAARYLSQGAVSYIYYADRLNQLPLGIIGIAVGTAILPVLSRQIGGGDEQGAADTQNRAIEIALFLALPAAVALAVAALPIVRGVLEYGAFDRTDAQASAITLAGFAIGVPAYVLIKVLTPGFYARQDSRTPVRIAFAAMIVNLAGNLTLIWTFGPLGVALATALSAWVNVLMLVVTLRRRGHLSFDHRLFRRGLGIVGASAAMGAALWVGAPVCDAWMNNGLILRLLALAALCLGGLIVYGVAGLVMGAWRIGDLRGFRPRGG